MPALEEPGGAALYLVGGDQDLRKLIREVDIIEVPVRYLLNSLCGILLLRHTPRAMYAVPHRYGEDLPALGFVELDQRLGTVLGLAVLSRLGQAQSQDAAGRGSCYQVEHLRDPLPRTPLDLSEDNGRYDAPNTTPVDRQHFLHSHLSFRSAFERLR